MAFFGGQIYLQGRPARRETAAHSLQSDQGGAAAAIGAVGKIGPTEAVRPDTRSARGELMESPTRLCRTEGSAQHSVETPARVATAERATLGLGPQNTAVQHWQPVGGVNHPSCMFCNQQCLYH